jgi:hypothetical protein
MIEPLDTNALVSECIGSHAALRTQYRLTHVLIPAACFYGSLHSHFG